MFRVIRLLFFASVWAICRLGDCNDRQPRSYRPASRYVPLPTDFWHQQKKFQSNYYGRDMNQPTQVSSYDPIRNDHWQTNEFHSPRRYNNWDRGYSSSWSTGRNPGGHMRRKTYWTGFASTGDDNVLHKREQDKVSHNYLPSPVQDTKALFESFSYYPQSRPMNKMTSERLDRPSFNSRSNYPQDPYSSFKRYPQSRPVGKTTSRGQSDWSSWSQDYHQDSRRKQDSSVLNSFTRYPNSKPVNKYTYSDKYGAGRSDPYSDITNNFKSYPGSRPYGKRTSSDNEGSGSRRYSVYQSVDNDKTLEIEASMNIEGRSRKGLMERETDFLSGSPFPTAYHFADPFSQALISGAMPCCSGGGVPELQVISDLGQMIPQLPSPKLFSPPLLPPMYGLGGMQSLLPYHMQIALNPSNGGLFRVPMPYVVSPYRPLDALGQSSIYNGRNLGMDLSEAIFTRPSSFYSGNQFHGIRKFDEGVSLSDIYGQKNQILSPGESSEIISRNHGTRNLQNKQRYLGPTAFDISNPLDVDEALLDSIKNRDPDSEDEGASKQEEDNSGVDSSRAHDHVSIRYSNVTFMDSRENSRNETPKYIPQKNYHLNYFNLFYGKDGNKEKLEDIPAESKNTASGSSEEDQMGDSEITKLLKKFLADRKTDSSDTQGRAGGIRDSPAPPAHKINIFNSFWPSNSLPHNTQNMTMSLSPHESNRIHVGEAKDRHGHPNNDFQLPGSTDPSQMEPSQYPSDLEDPEDIMMMFRQWLKMKDRIHERPQRPGAVVPDNSFQAEPPTSSDVNKQISQPNRERHEGPDQPHTPEGYSSGSYPGFGTYGIQDASSYYEDNIVDTNKQSNPPRENWHSGDHLRDSTESPRGEGNEDYRSTVRAIFWNSRQPPQSFHEHRYELNEGQEDQGEPPLQSRRPFVPYPSFTNKSLGIITKFVKEPTTGAQGPITGAQGPITGAQGPITSAREPTTGAQGPGSSGERIVTKVPQLPSHDSFVKPQWSFHPNAQVTQANLTAFFHQNKFGNDVFPSNGSLYTFGSGANFTGSVLVE